MKITQKTKIQYSILPTFVILKWNANGLTLHGDELKHYLSTTSNKPDIICIQETFLKPKRLFTLPGYNIERCDRPGANQKGGLVTFIKAGISYTTKAPITNMECIQTEIQTATGNINIYNIYHAPDSPIDKTAYRSLFNLNNSILVGDFNAHSPLFGSNTRNEMGKLLETLIEEFQYESLNTGEGTYLKHNKGTSPLDLTICSPDTASNCTWSVLKNTFGSDHFPTITEMKVTLTEDEPPLERWAYKKANWRAFQQECLIQLTEDLVTTDITLSYSNVVATITSLASKHILLSKPMPPKKKVLFWNDECTNAVENRNRAKNKMQVSNNLDDCMSYRHLKEIAQRTIKDAKKQSWQEYCSTIDDSTKLGKIWKTASKMTGDLTKRTN